MHYTLGIFAMQVFVRPQVLVRSTAAAKVATIAKTPPYGGVFAMLSSGLVHLYIDVHA